MFYISHGDPHPTRGKSEEKRKEELIQVAKQAVQDGRIWKMRNMQATEQQISHVASMYSVLHWMDDKKADLMIRKFIEGTTKVVSNPEIGWEFADLRFLLKVKGYTYRKEKGNIIIQGKQKEENSTYSDSYHGIQAAVQDVLTEIEMKDYESNDFGAIEGE